MNCNCGNPIVNVPEHLLDIGVLYECHDCQAGSAIVHVPKPHLCDKCGCGEPAVVFPSHGLGRRRNTCSTCRPDKRKEKKTDDRPGGVEALAEMIGG